MRRDEHSIELPEYGESDPLEDKLADRLYAAGQRALERTRHGIKAKGVVGIISVPGATVEILPKCCSIRVEKG